MKKFLMAIAICAGMFGSAVMAKTVGSVDTEFKLIGGNSSIEIESLKDEDVEGVTCHISYAKSGGISGSLGLAEDPSRFSIACRQTGPLVLIKDIEKQDKVASFSRNVFFKNMLVTRMFDKENKTLIYLIHSKRLIDGSPYNSISTIPLMDWNGVAPSFK